MRVILRTMLLLCAVPGMYVPSTLSAQDTPAQKDAEAKPQESRSKFDSFVARKGILLVKHFYAIGEMRWTGGLIKVQAVHAYEAGKKDGGFFALIFEKPATERFASDVKATLDYDESVSLAGAIDVMTTFAKDQAMIDHESLEVEFKTTDGFSCGLVQTGRDQKVYVNVSRFGKGLAFSRFDDIKQARDLVDRAIAKLKSVGAR